MKHANVLIESLNVPLHILVSLKLNIKEIDKLNYIKIKKFSSSKNILIRMKKQATWWGKIFAISIYLSIYLQQNIYPTEDS